MKYISERLVTESYIKDYPRESGEEPRGRKSVWSGKADLYASM